MFPPDRIILILFALMFAGGTLDYLLGNRLGIGKKITEGLQAFAPLFLTMAGFIVLTPVLARISAPVIVPVFTAFGADPGLFPGIILANDNGAYPLAKSLCIEQDAAGFGGMLLGSVLGANVISIPLVFQLLCKEDRQYYFKGLVFGVITIPIGLFAGGLAAGYRLSFILRQMPPLILISVTAAVLLKLAPDFLIKVLGIFARTMEILAILGMTAAVFLEASGLSVSWLISIQEAIKIVGSIVIVLPGVYIFIAVLTPLLRKMLPAIVKKLQINEHAVIGFLTTTANAIPTLMMLKNMDKRGKLLNCAFLSSGAYMLGDHLAFCGATAPQLLFPLMITKLVAGVTATLCAFLYLKKTEE